MDLIFCARTEIYSMLRLSCSLNLPGALAPPLCSVAAHILSAFPIFNCTSSCNRVPSDATEGSSFSLSALREGNAAYVSTTGVSKNISSGMHFLFAHSRSELRPRMRDRSMSNKILQRPLQHFLYMCSITHAWSEREQPLATRACSCTQRVQEFFISATEKYFCCSRKIFLLSRKKYSTRSRNIFLIELNKFFYQVLHAHS